MRFLTHANAKFRSLDSWFNQLNQAELKHYDYSYFCHNYSTSLNSFLMWEVLVPSDGPPLNVFTLGLKVISCFHIVQSPQTTASGPKMKESRVSWALLVSLVVSHCPWCCHFHAPWFLTKIIARENKQIKEQKDRCSSIDHSLVSRFSSKTLKQRTSENKVKSKQK